MILTLTCSDCGRTLDVRIDDAAVEYHATPLRLAIAEAKAQGWIRKLVPTAAIFCPRCAKRITPKKRAVGRPEEWSRAKARKLVAQGKSMAEVGRRLGVSREAVRQGLRQG